MAQGVEVHTYHDEGKTLLKETYFIVDSGSTELNGPYTSCYINGAIEKTGYYKYNLPDSIWTYYYEGGSIKMTGMMRSGQTHGLWEYYFENGNRRMAGIIINSRREGNWIYYYENATIKSQGDFQADTKHGIWNYFYEDGALKAQEYYNKGTGRYKEFYNSGKIKAEGLNKFGVSDSTWVFYYESGKTKGRGNYKEGKRIGEWVFYYENEMVSSKGSYEDGREQGKWEHFNENGTLSSEGAVRDGKKEGYWRFFNDKGIFSAQGVYIDDTGKFTEYYESGKIKSEGNILNGKNEGQWYYYYEDNSKEGECFFVNGTGEYIGYYTDGTIKMKGQIKDGVNTGIWQLYKENGELAGLYRPYYEENRPVYKLVESDQVEKGNYLKPAYKYKNYKSRYFDPVINEYKGHIISINPFATLIGQMPVSYEYYIAERLGYEAIVSLIRDPFYTSGSSMELNEVYNRGLYVAIRQKYYHPQNKIGSFYFGQEARVTFVTHNSNVADSTVITQPPYELVKINTNETRLEYAPFVGNRWIHFFGERYNNKSVGISIDAFLGFGFGYRFYKKDYAENSAYDEVFGDVNDSKFLISPRVGFSVGLIF